MNVERRSGISELLKDAGPISFDIDGVIVFSVEKALEKTNKKLKANYKLTDIDEPYAMQGWMKADPTIKEPIREDFELWHSESVLAHASIVPGADIVCRLMAKLNHEHYFITSRPAFVKPFTHYWFEHGIPWVKPQQILMQKEGQEVSSDFKTDRIKEMGITFHFEDTLEHAVKIVERTKATVIVVRHKWTDRYAELRPENRNPRILIPDKKGTSLFLSFETLLNHLRFVAQC